MNERIQELLIEAHKQTNGGIYNGHLSEWTEKFAELIVNECQRVSLTCSHGDDAMGAIIARRIKEYFGIK
jgi:hypothetical protein